MDSSPREFAQQTMVVSGGTGSKIINLVGYLDALLIDVPANEGYKISIKGPMGVEYYISPNTLFGDNTVLFDTALPMTGKMTFSVIGASGDGFWYLTPVGNLK